MARVSERLTQPAIEAAATLSPLRNRLDGVVAQPDSALLELLAQLIEREASVMAYNDVFVVLGMSLLTGLLAIPLLRRPQH